ncbi:MAG: ABC transporter ATP-binding protein [Bacteriovoracaceae bacterium]|nr:ABC transporter ATP-binding protein [Bacteriovoracaceae bacterium]
MATKDIQKKIIQKITAQRIYKNYSHMWPYVRPIWFRALCSVLICIPIGSLNSVIALVLRPYMDVVMLEKQQPVWYIPLAIVAFTSLQGGLTFISAYLNAWVGTKMANGLKTDLFKKILTFSTSFFDQRKSGDVIMQFNTMADGACSGLVANFAKFMQVLFQSISLVGVLFYQSWQLAMIATAVLAAALAPVAKIRKLMSDVFSKSVVADSAILTEYNEIFAGNRTVTAYNLARRELNRFKNILENVFRLRIKMVQRTQWLSPMMHVIVAIGIAITLGYGQFLISSGKMTPGAFVSFITALILLYTPIKSIGETINQVQMSFFMIEGVFANLELKPKIADRPHAQPMPREYNLIKFENVSFAYNPETPILKHINLEVHKGQTIALVGNSGGGKTTTVNLLPRFYDIQEGRITVDGVDIRDFTLKSLRDNMAVVFQDNFLFSGTIRENIMLGDENASPERVQKAVEMAYLDEFIASLRDGLDTRIGERGILLSGGQKQRVAIARAFLKDAPIIILDEATSALDNKAESIVQKAINNLMQDKTVFVIAHRLSTIQNADKIVVINEGRVIEEGTHHELLQIENGAYKSLYELQFASQEDEQDPEA